MRVYVDHTHLWRQVTGVERITALLFSKESLAPLDVVPVTADSIGGMIVAQNIGLPARLALTGDSTVLCPGFPPMPLLHAFGARVIPYIHDVFLVSRRADLNWRARLYAAWPFALALRRLPRFMVNSANTVAKLAAYCRDDAEIVVYRPPAQNIFALSRAGRAERSERPLALRFVALGTVEPRKNLLAAARIVAVLREQRELNATLDIVGRRGWGDDWCKLAAMPGVTLHGYQPEAYVNDLLDAADALICTSHEEGLGLPLLEAQFAGLPVIAPEQPVFHEVLGDSGIFIDPANPAVSAATIVRELTTPGWRKRFADLATRNLQRWNTVASADRDRVIDMVGRLARDGGSAPNRLGAAH